MLNIQRVWNCFSLSDLCVLIFGGMCSAHTWTLSGSLKHDLMGLCVLCAQTGGTEEVYKEQKRQQELENNYRFVWGEKQEETQSSGAADSDDVDFWDPVWSRDEKAGEGVAHRGTAHKDEAIPQFVWHKLMNGNLWPKEIFIWFKICNCYTLFCWILQLK